ncbi:hypothetical protein CR513_28368, partial [Mucuna pruriens]
LVTSQSRKTMINLNLRGAEELWNCFGSGYRSSVGETHRDIARIVHPKRRESNKNFIRFTQLAPKPPCFLRFSLKRSQSNSVASIHIQPRPNQISLHRDYFVYLINETRLNTLLSVRQLVVGQHQPIVAIKACGICTSVEFPTDMCPTLQETKSNHAKSVATSTGSSRMQPGHLRANNSDGHHTDRIQIKGQMQLKDSIQTEACFQVPSFQQQQQQKTPPPGDSLSLDNLVKQLATSNLEF